MKKWFVIWLLLTGLRTYASHIVGGEMIYDYLGNNNYRITLKIYRDCGSLTPFDGLLSSTGGYVPANISVLEVNGGSVGLYDIGAPVVSIIPPTINNPCIQTPQDICVEEGIYTYTLMLPPKAGGYYVVYQRCCRNNTIVNLLNSGSQGSTYFAKIPGPETAVGNNSPRFKNFPPIFLCNKLDFTFNHMATDPDGDQLVYSLCPPFLGIDGCCTFVGNGNPPGPSPNCDSPPAGCPMIATPPPYSLVNFVAPYNGSYPIASNPAVTIDANTGLLSGTPELTGQYVVGVCVQEFRNNVLISTHFRDFQFNIVSCVVSVLSAVANQKKQCIGNTVSFVNQSTSNVGQLTYLWDFGDPNLSDDTSGVVNPTYTYQDTGIYDLTLIANPGKACSDTVKKKVYVFPALDVDFASPPRQCLTNNAFKFQTKGLTIPQTTYEWHFTASATPSTSTLKDPVDISFKEPGLYYVSMTAKHFSCRDSTTDSVRVLKRPQAVIKNTPVVHCDPVTITFTNGSVSDRPLDYYWSFNNGKTADSFETTQKFSAGNYTARLLVVTKTVCADTSTDIFSGITVLQTPVAGFSISPEVASIFEPEISISSRASSDALKWEYNFGDGTRSVFPYEKHIYKDYGDYVITQTVTNQFGCQDSVSHLVRILPEFLFWIPNTFTPDNNSVNDLFGPTVIGVADYEFRIYNRWGQKVFETSNVNEGWNGSFKGVDCAEDIYVWRITFRNVTDQKTEVRTGHVLVVRNL